MFFDAFLMLIVFINYVGWSGAYINLATGVNPSWDNSYFGFTSIQIMIRVLNEQINSVDALKPSMLINYGQEVLNDITFNIPYFLNKVATGNLDILGIVKLIVSLLVQPLMLTLHILLMLGCILWYALNFASIIFFAFGGMFNVPMDNTLDWQQVQTGYNEMNRIIGRIMI